MTSQIDTVYRIGAQNPTPTVLLGVLRRHGVTHLIDVRRAPDHPGSNLQARFLKPLFDYASGPRYSRLKAPRPARPAGEIDRGGATLPRTKLDTAWRKLREELAGGITVPCFLTTGASGQEEHYLPRSVLVAWWGNETFCLRDLNGTILYKDALVNLGLHAGNVYDLSEMCQELNAQYFNGRYRVADIMLAWEATPRLRHRRLGYFRPPALIALNALLDHQEIPPEVVKAVLYHEMIHMQLYHDGCSAGHTVEFFQKESCFQDYARMFWFDIVRVLHTLDELEG